MRIETFKNIWINGAINQINGGMWNILYIGPAKLSYHYKIYFPMRIKLNSNDSNAPTCDSIWMEQREYNILLESGIVTEL